MVEHPYRVPDPYLAAWATLERPRPAARAAGHILIVGAVLLVWPALPLGGQPLNQPLLWLTIAMCLAGAPLLAFANHGLFRCPRCSKRFFRGAEERGARDCCKHCGIKIGTPKAATDAYTPTPVR